MTEYEKERGFMDKVKGGLHYFSELVSAIIFPPLAEGAEMIMKNIDDRIIQIEERILRKVFSFLVIGFGGVFLIFSLFFLLIEYLHWSNAAAFFSIGITIFVIGLLLKIANSEK